MCDPIFTDCGWALCCITTTIGLAYYKYKPTDMYLYGISRIQNWKYGHQIQKNISFWKMSILIYRWSVDLSVSPVHNKNWNFRLAWFIQRTESGLFKSSWTEQKKLDHRVEVLLSSFHPVLCKIRYGHTKPSNNLQYSVLLYFVAEETTCG
jgi:hypothetical protein